MCRAHTIFRMRRSQVWLSYDPDADAAYLRLGEPPRHDPLGTGRFAGTHVLKASDDGWPGAVNVDVDAEGRILGIEILGAARLLPHERL
jgi:uncharacterized protein YuzE